jgi:hypothetical protein
VSLVLLCAEYIEGAVWSRTGNLYIAVKQIAGSTDILLFFGFNNIVTIQRLCVWYCYVLSALKVQFTVELVKCTLLLNRLLVLQIH